MATLNTNTLDAATTSITITTEKLITMYVDPISGGTDNYKVCLQISPDGTDWYDVHATVVTGRGHVTASCVAAEARAVVVEAEGATSSVDITILAN